MCSASNPMTNQLTPLHSACISLQDCLIDVIARAYVTQFFEVTSCVGDDVSR